MTVIQMPGAELERREGSTHLARWITADGIDQIARALPEGVPLSRFDQALAIAMIKEPALEKADRTSLFLALVDAAKRGLMPDGQQGAIVVFKEKAQFLPMIGGVRDTLAEYGWLLKTACVYSADQFTIDEAEARVSHRRALTGDRGEIIGAYALATHRDGRQRMAAWMPKTEIDELRDKMGVANNPAWKKWYPQMAEKTVGHRLADDVPLAPQDRRRVEWIINATELPPAELLYGPGASFSEIPAGRDMVDMQTGEIHEAPSDGVPQPSTDAAPETPGANAGGGETEPTDATAPAASTIPEPDEEAVMLAAESAEYVPPSGKYAEGGEAGPLDLAGILDLGDDGRAYLAMCLRRVTDPVWRGHVEAFCRVNMPDEYAAVAAARAEAA